MNQNEFANEAAAVAAGLDRVARDYVGSGCNALTVGIAMASQGAGIMVHQSNPKVAADTLRAIASKIEGEAGKPPLDRPATSSERAAIGRAALEALAGEFLALANDCITLIEGGDSTLAREKLLDVTRKLASPRPSTH